MDRHELGQPEVAAVGLRAVPLRGHEAAPSPRTGTPEELLAELRHATAPLVLVVGASDAEAQRRARVLRSALDGRRPVAVLDTRLPPLGAAVLAALGASLAPLAPGPGVLAEALHLLEADLVIAAGVTGVARLKDPRPPLGARVRSLLPGARYVVRRRPGPLVASAAQPPDLLDGDHVGVAVLLAGAEAALEAPLAAAFPGAPVDVVEAFEGAGRHWGGGAVLEAVAYPADRQALAADLLGLPAAPCPWCGEPVAAVPCPVCGHDRNPALVEVSA